ncbi:MAG: prepilin-type N-terminal cleavage/methylation domain-containing protein [Bacteroidetes bacterium]|nr:prepilin-type N-terminal cleavage/methylation domain-containing protein [Bacteroidota bacterium]
MSGRDRIVNQLSTGSTRRCQSGFTLIELVIIIVTLGILAAVAIPKFADIGESAKETATRKELQELRLAVVGNPDLVAGGKPVAAGYEGNVGHLPNQLSDLVDKPDSIAPYDRLTGLGWHGPYIDSTGGSYLRDAWGSAYLYDRLNRRLFSVGGTDTIGISL